MFEIPETTTVWVTPAMAREWLKHNTGNRPVRNLLKRKIDSDMRAGRWRYVGDPIRFAKSGRLMDGQHRLLVLASMPDDFCIPFAVIRGLDDDDQLVMDQGVTRAAGDQLQMLGFKRSLNVASAARLLVNWESGLIWGKQPVVSTPAIVEWVQEHPGDVARVQNAVRGRESVDAPASVIGCAAILFGRIDDELALEFLSKLFSGSGGGEGNPITALDKRLSRIRRTKTRLSQRDYLALFIMAWNAWVNGRLVYKFITPEAGWSKDTFPEIAKPVTV